jgi:ABC-type uncharacterized transport system permease subunit
MAQTKRQRLVTRASDVAARWVITLGGLLTIGSLGLMFLLIVKESLPLFAKGEVAAGGAAFEIPPKPDEPGDAFRLETRPPAPITAKAWLLGDQTLLAGDARGRLYGLMRVRPTPEADERVLRVVHVFPPHDSAITALAPSTRGKLFLAGDASGRITVSNATNERTIAEVRVPGPVERLAFSPRSDGFAAVSGGTTRFFASRAPHHEASWRALFGKIWY